VAVVQYTFTHIHTLYDELDVVKVTKIGRLRWLGNIFRMQELNHCRKLTVIKPEGTRRVGKPKLRWLELVEELETKIAGQSTMKDNFGGGYSSPRTLMPEEEEAEGEENRFHNLI